MSVLLEVVLCTVVLGYHWQHQYVALLSFLLIGSHFSLRSFQVVHINESVNLPLLDEDQEAKFISVAVDKVCRRHMRSRKLGESVPVLPTLHPSPTVALHPHDLHLQPALAMHVSCYTPRSCVPTCPRVSSYPRSLLCFQQQAVDALLNYAVPPDAATFDFATRLDRLRQAEAALRAEVVLAGAIMHGTNGTND